MSTALPSGLTEQILKGNCVLFLGTGFGQVDGGGVYDRDLAKELVKYCDYDELDHNLVKVAEYYELSLGRHSLIERVSEWVDRQTSVPSLLDQIVARLPFTIVVSTRIDLLLEDAYRQLERLVTKVVRDEEVAFADSQKVMLLKLHGSVDQKDTLILTQRDHLDLLRKRPILSEFIKLLYATKTILFLGYDLDNTYSRLLHQEIVQEIGRFTRRAYAVWEQPRPNTIKYWSSNSIEIINSDPLQFLQLPPEVMFCQYAPYHLRGREWSEEVKNEMADRIIATVTEFAPNFADAVIYRQVLSPVDIERRYGMPNGNIFHGEITPDQLFSLRPTPECARYRTPVDGLYLCGSGVHPGGGVMGAPGHNAAKALLSDWAK